MKLSCALVACNENPHYLQFWPYVKRAWMEVVGIPCVMVYVGEVLPEELREDPAVIHFPPIGEWPTATQAQVIRLLYPALLKCDGAVVLSDMDMIPLQRTFFTEGFAQFKEDQFVSLRGMDEQEKQIYMCYVGATPQTWSDVFRIKTLENIRECMGQWASHVAADGAHGGQGWCTDQLILYNVVQGWLQTRRERIGLVPWTAQIPRLDRGNPAEWVGLDQSLLGKIKSEVYVDFHMPPLQYCHQHIEMILSYFG